MILLTDEEIRDAKASVIASDHMNLKDIAMAVDGAMLKAQLKKVLNEAKVEDMSWKFRQSLFEEVK